MKFASIISPGSLKNLTLIDRSGTISKGRTSTTLHVKQSYILLTWINYLRCPKPLTKHAGQERTSSLEKDEPSIPSFFTYPIKQNKLTYLKAPMAHKTFSQEQFLTKSYEMSISFNNSLSPNSKITNINSSIYTLLYLRNNYLNFETNLFFLKKLKVNLTVSDTTFFLVS